MFWRSRALYFHQKSIKNDVGTRGGIGTDFFMIFDGFRPPFRGPFPRKSEKKRCRKRRRIRRRKKSEKRAKRRSFEEAGVRGGGARGFESGENSEIRTEPTCESPKHAGPGGGGGYLKARAPLPPAPNENLEDSNLESESSLEGSLGVFLGSWRFWGPSFGTLEALRWHLGILNCLQDMF